MNKKLLGALALTLPFSANADIIGATFGAYTWNQSWSGSIQSEEALATKVDLEDDLGYDDENGNSFFVALEHPIPLLPNIRLAHTELEISETNTLSRAIEYEGKKYTINTPVNSKMDLSHTDATLYYEILDNIVSLDIGLTARIFDGEAKISGSGQTGSTDLDGTIPLLFASARFNLPLTGLYVGAEAHAISYSGNSITDVKANIGYEIGIVAVELGFRSFDIDLEADDDEKFDLTVDGAFLGIVIDI